MKKFKKFLQFIFSIKNFDDNNRKLVTIMGLKIKFKEPNSNFYYLQKTNIQAAAQHPRTFNGYQNKYNGQKIALIACGPTLKYYSQIPDTVHIGVNRSFLHKNITALDYLFIQDRLEHDMELANKYLPDKCQKFYGVIPERRYSKVKNKIIKISNQDIVEANAKIYILEDSVRRNWANNLEIEPIGDWLGCVFSALQFAMYTNPEVIYLVGCDCSAKGHFYKEKPSIFKNKNLTNLEYQLKPWQHFKEIATKMYPHTKIISVNPVGLKGMFQEVYTQSYINAHPEQCRNKAEILPSI